jgi:SAM-dependent methyltransferase
LQPDNVVLQTRFSEAVPFVYFCHANRHLFSNPVFMNSDIVRYYKERASEYEKIYAKPERQADLAEAATLLKVIFAGKHVFEIACGTGYWTQQIAETADSILATDINPEVLDIAKQKEYSKANVSFEVADFNNYDGIKHQSLFGGFIWSHIELQHLDGFLSRIFDYVVPGGTIVLMDNKNVEGSNIPIAETDANGNTYQHRALSNGSLHRVLKNFPTEDFIRNKLNDRAVEIVFIELRYYWILQFNSRI